MAIQPFWIFEGAEPEFFPNPDNALAEPNGLLAAGGDLSAPRLMCAYRNGIFPWYSEHQPILWWSPDPRAVLFPEDLKISRSLRKKLRSGTFEITVDQSFADVVRQCAAPRVSHDGTWITSAMFEAYVALHELGYAHSIEYREDGILYGGLYGVVLGQVFYGESMFSRRSDASKIALQYLCSRGFQLIDCQIESDHLTSLGATELPRREFVNLLDHFCVLPSPDLGVATDGEQR